ncbi:MAG: hypothetical protein ACOX16_03895 [Candidatus Izemoplasmatales bacterium]|jgi:hypothetical protein
MKLLTHQRIVLAFALALFALFLLGCKEETTTTADIIVEPDAIIPAISHPDVVFYSFGDIEITYGDIYREFKVNDGINQLLFMVDTVLLADYLDQVTETEITDKRNQLTYGLTDPEKIAELDAAKREEMEANYLQSMLFTGYHDGDVPLLKILIAKDKYATIAMKSDANSEKLWHVGPKTVAKYYAYNYDRTLASIKIKFTSETDAKEVMRGLNLVGRSGGLLYRYTGTRPISEIPSSGFDDTNTVLLEDDELIEAFIEMYNAVYGVYRNELDSSDSFSELCANPDLVVEYSTVAKANTALATQMFSVFSTYEEHLSGTATSVYYTNKPVKYYSSKDTSYYMFINLKRPEKADLADFAGTKAELEALIGADVYQEIETLLVKSNLADSSFTAERLVELRRERGFKIFDYFLGIDYKRIDAEYEPDEVGHATNLAAYDDTVITADAFFDFAMKQNAPINLLYAAQMPYLIKTHYADIYCYGDDVCDYDVATNTSMKMEKHRSDLLERKKAFLESSYAAYYTFEEYVYLGFRATSEDELLKTYYVKLALQPVAIYEEIMANDWKLLEEYLKDKVDEAYDNYFSLNVNHLLIYVDRNEDGSPDDYNEFVEGEADQERYADLITAFEEAILLYLNESDENTFQTLITAYNRAKRTDPVWGEFKNYGFYLMQENLSSSGSLTYAKSNNVYVSAFVEGMKEAYEAYRLETNITKTEYLHETFVETVFGLHLLNVTKGTNFTQPSAAFTMIYDDEQNPEYDPDMVNSDERLSLAQLKVYAQYRLFEMLFGTDTAMMEAMDVTMPKIPTTVKTALATFFKDLHDSVYVMGTLNTKIISILSEGEIVDQNHYYGDIDLESMQEALSALHDIYFEQVFPGYDPS